LIISDCAPTPPARRRPTRLWMLASSLLALVASAQLARLSAAATVKLSNVALPLDQNGEKLITGEADVVKHGDTFFLYFNNWGPCPGVDCCKSAAGCATCCFKECALRPCSFRASARW
jgi:hypothetical protein